MNQRRSDWSCGDWSQVAELLRCRTTRVETIRRGYRTSSSIMQFADQLLPRMQRTVESLQVGGERPRIEKVRLDDLPARVVQEARGLTTRHPDGTVAVIVPRKTEKDDVERVFRQAGFLVEEQDESRFFRGKTAVRVLGPQQARGLEFDAVVVVEPSVFPLRQNAHGSLYTSLTRANRELVIVHSLPLPEKLRGISSPRAPKPEVIPAQRSPAVPVSRSAT